MALFAQHVPTSDRATRERKIPELQFLHPLGKLLSLRSRPADPRKIALNIGRKHWHTDAAECLRHHLQRHCFTRTGRARDQAVPVCHLWQQVKWRTALPNEKWFHHVCELPQPIE